MIAAGVWLLLVAAFVVTVHYADKLNKRRNNKPRRAELDTSLHFDFRPEPLTLHAPRETPADAEWRRRMKRWADEQGDLS